MFFLSCFQSLALMRVHYLQCWRILFLLFFLTHRVYLCYLSDVKTCFIVSFFLSSGSFFPALFEEWSWVSYKEESPSVYPLDKTPATKFCFEEISRTFEIIFFISFMSSPFVYWCPLSIFRGICRFPFSQRSDSFLIWQFYSFHYSYFSAFHYY